MYFVRKKTTIKIEIGKLRDWLKKLIPFLNVQCFRYCI